MPIELGDIIEIDDKHFMLVGQPCDLVVRKSGTRSLNVYTLIEIEIPEDPDKNKCK